MKRFGGNAPGKKATSILLALAALCAASYLVYARFFETKYVIASISPYNFSDIGVSDLYVNGTWGGNSYPHTGGGSGVCCVYVPAKWRPGLTVNIKWHDDSLNDIWYTAQPEVPPYTKPAGLQVLFFPGNKVKVYVNDYWPCTTMHPMPKDPCDKPDKS
jgi:hypothetical protein